MPGGDRDQNGAVLLRCLVEEDRAARGLLAHRVEDVPKGLQELNHEVVAEGEVEDLEEGGDLEPYLAGAGSDLEDDPAEHAH